MGLGETKPNLPPPFIPGLEKKGREVLSSPPEAQGGGECGLQSVHHMLALPSSLTSSSSGAGLLTPFPCTVVGSLPWETVPLKVLQCGSFPRGAVRESQSTELEGTPKDCPVHILSEWPLWGSVLQEEAAPARVPHGITNPASKPPVHTALPMGTQIQPPATSHTLLKPYHTDPMQVQLKTAGINE